MKHFTRCIVNEQSDKAQSAKNMVAEPRMETLTFIRQFARIYRYESKLEDQLGSYIVN
jgi:hypothetical protein